MHPKIKRDPYLSLVCERHGEQAVMASGFFFDEDDRDAPLDDTDWLCTPRPKREITGERPVVLLSTGGLCPVHAGHLAMMESARAAAIANGRDVIGGYLSPGHDAYLRLKCGSAAIPARERLRLCAEAVRESDWLSVDPWESMHRRVSVNFTDVTARLEAYVKAHVDPRVEVLFVCGADNARFAHAFSERGGCVIVGRPGAEWSPSNAPHVLWAEGGHTAASHTMRAARWIDEPKRRLVLRLEDARAVRTLKVIDHRRFQLELTTILSQHAKVRTTPLRDHTRDQSTISLDAMSLGDRDLAISRLFAVGGYEALGHVERPGSKALAEQVAAIPPGDYVLCDDDRMTGSTLEAARALFPSSIRIERTELAITHEEDEDVTDSRDFLLGADHGGLVLQLPNGLIGRAPYLLPYVDPAVRASIRESLTFSIEVWKLNARTFANTDLRIRDLPEPTRITFSQFDNDRRLDDVCSWHVERLESYVHGGLTERRDDGKTDVTQPQQAG